MQNAYSDRAEFECDCFACRFDAINLLNNDTYKLLDDGRVVRKATWANGKPDGGYF